MNKSNNCMHGRNWLSALSVLPVGCPAAVFVRHAERYPITDFAASNHILLTPQGEADATAVGGLLPLNRHVRLWHSPVHRCGQTAERLAEGLAASGGRADVAGELGMLCGSFVKDIDKVSSLSRQHGDGFVRSWFDGCFDSTVIDPRDVAAARLLSAAEQVLAASQPDTLNLMVTHDWEIVTIRETYLGVRHEEVGWVGYLDGVAMARDVHMTHLAWGKLSRRMTRRG